jgi:tripartite-type tricarboxylate transporter receptor subunit TctC
LNFRPFVLSLLLALPLCVQAQAYPTKPIRLVVPWPPGTPADVIGRTVAEKMAGGLGQPIVIDNKPGAAGTIGLADALNQPANGYTLYMLSSASLVAPLLFPNQPIDFTKSLQPIGMMAWSYNVLVVPSASALQSPKDIVQASKAKPNSLNFASGGPGTPAHLAGELFKQQTSIEATHVPYNQFTLAIADLVSDRANYMFLTASAALPQIQGGRLRPLAVTSEQRLPALKDVPTMKEQGFNEFVLRSFDGLTAKAGTPPEVVERLSAELNKALADPAVRERLATLALEPQPMSSAAFTAVLATESNRWLNLGRAAKIKAD